MTQGIDRHDARLLVAALQDLEQLRVERRPEPAENIAQGVGRDPGLDHQLLDQHLDRAERMLAEQRPRRRAAHRGAGIVQGAA
jgi:hypothetical protein